MANDPNFPDTGLQIKPSNHALEGGQEWDVFDSAEDIKSFGIAGRVWEAAFAARRYFSEAAEPASLDLDPVPSLFGSSEHIALLELGAGAGYGGLHLCKCLEQHRRRQSSPSSSHKAHVILTDLPNVQPLLNRNIARTTEADPSLADVINIEAWPCAWGDGDQARAVLAHLQDCAGKASPAGQHLPALTHILAADLVYFPELFPPLLRSLIWFTEPEDQGSEASQTPEVIFTYKVRSLVKEQPFWAVFGSWFSFEAVLCRERSAPKTSEAEAERPWRRFGEHSSDVKPVPKSGAAAKGVDGDESDQQIYVFLAHRKTSTFGWTAPVQDKALMDGRRERRLSSDSGQTETITELDDTFEMLLLNSIGL